MRRHHDNPQRFEKSPANRPPAVGALARNFALTAAETRLLKQLASNATLSQAARTLGISLETARTHLAHILAWQSWIFLSLT
jgi:DNA-binding CsgD family transcriptional regulator